MEETNYAFPDRNSDIKGWVRTDDLSPYEACLIRTDKEGKQWVALSHSYWDEDKAPNEIAGIHLTWQCVLIIQAHS